jgi:hypothetical protein
VEGEGGGAAFGTVIADDNANGSIAKIRKVPLPFFGPKLARPDKSGLEQATPGQADWRRTSPRSERRPYRFLSAVDSSRRTCRRER